jgi:hypothetical protein
VKFCQYCGARLGDGPYCGNCGRPVAAAATQPVVGDASATQPVPEGDQTRLEDRPITESAVPPSKHPFGDIRPADYVRDLAALILLIASLSMPWDAVGVAADRLHVVLVTLLAMASLVLPYLKRAGVLPSDWGNAEVRVARALANVPYFVVVVLTIVIDIAADQPASGGVGVGVGFGLAGAVLAAQARTADYDNGPDQGDLWRLITLGLAAAVGALTVVRIVVVLVRLADAPAADWAAVTLALLEPLIFLAVLAVPVVGLLARRESARIVLLSVGVMGVVMGLWRMSEGSGLPEVLAIRDLGPMELLWLATAAAVSAAGVSSVLTPVSGYEHWIGAATRALGLAAVLTGLAALFWIVVVTSFDTGRGTSITVLLLLLLALVAAVVGRSSVRSNPRHGRPVALAVAGLLLLIAIVDLAVETAGQLGLFTISALTVTGLVVLAALVVLALTAPRPVRDQLGPVQFGEAPPGGRPGG